MSDVDEVLAGTRRWCVVGGDCIEVMRSLPTQCVDHVLTDPPYGEEFHGKARTQGKDGAERDVEYGFDGITSEQRLWAAQLFERLVRRWVLVFSDPESSRSWRDALEGQAMRYIRKCIWVKEACTPQLTGDRPASGHEEITTVHASLARTPGRTRWNGGGERGVWSYPIVRDVDDGREHTTPKPVPLMLRLVTLFTDPDDIILDPFAGSGTTGVAALRLNRRCILIEKQAKYVELIRERLEAEEHMSTLTATRAKQEALF